MEVPSSHWIRGITSTAGAVLAGPTGAVVGSLVGEVFQRLLPGVASFLGDVSKELAKDAILSAGQQIAHNLAPAEVQRINHDLQGAFRDGCQQALYDLGGRESFPEVWKAKPRDVPGAIVYPQTPDGHHLWQTQSPLAGQVADLFHHLTQALQQGKLLPWEPPYDRLEGSALGYLHRQSTSPGAAETPGETESVRDFNNRFFNQEVAPFLSAYASLLDEAPGLENHLRLHLLDRTLVHFGELIKTRDRAWRAFNRAVLEEIYQQGRELGKGQEAVLQQLEKLTTDQSANKIADDLASILAAFGKMEKRLDDRLEQLVENSLAQYGVLQQHMETLLNTSQRIEEDVLRVIKILESDSFRKDSTPVITLDPPSKPTAPPSTTDLIGRSVELEQYSAALHTHHLSVIQGMPGIGKSALAAMLVERIHDPAQVFWFAFHAGSDLITLFRALGGFLYWHNQVELWQMMQGAVNANNPLPPVGVLLGYVETSLRQKGYLLCLDNLERVEKDPNTCQFLHILETMTQRGELDVILISAHRISDLPVAETYEPLAGLRFTDILQLLVHRQIKIERALAEQLHIHSGGNAQILMLAVDMLLRGKQPQKILDMLTESERVDDFVEKNFYQGLDEDERLVLGAISIFLGFPVSRDGINFVLEGKGDLRVIIKSLTSRHLIQVTEYDEKRMFGLNNVLREFYYDNLDAAQRRSMHRRAAHYFQGQPDPLQAAIHFQKAGESAKAMPHAISHVRLILNRGGAVALDEILAEFKPLPDLFDQASLDLARGQVKDFLGNTELANQYYHSALESLESHPDTVEKRRLQAEVCLGLGELYQDDNLPEAIGWLEKGMKLLSPTQDEQLGAALHIRLGRVYANQGETTKAQEELLKGLTRLPQKLNRLHISALGNLGNLAFQRGDVTLGRRIYNQVLRIARVTDDFWSISEANLNLDFEMDLAGDWVGAQESYLQELEKAEVFGSHGHRLRARLLLGILCVKRGEDSTAEAYLLDCIKLAHTSAPNYLVYALPGLADLYLRQGKMGKAAQLLEDALALNQELGSGQAEALPEIYRLRAILLLEKGNRQAAQKPAAEALEQALKSENRLEIGAAHRVMGQVQAANLDHASAEASFKQGLKLQEGLYPYEAALTRLAWGKALLTNQQRDQARLHLNAAQKLFIHLGARREIVAIEAMISHLP